jgi:hypothetical protein
MFKSYFSLTQMHCLALAIALGALPSSPARAQHSDVFLTAVGGRVAIGGANEPGTVDENYDLTTRLFEGVMVPDFPPFTPADYGRNEPGFVALPNGSPLMPPGAAALPANQLVALQLSMISLGGASDSLFFWNGTGMIDFQPISSAQPGVAFSFGTNPIGATGASGDLHLHTSFELDNGGPGVPADGVYLVAPTARISGLADSDPFTMVWLVDALIVDDEAAEQVEEALEAGTFEALGKNFAFFEEAVAFVQDNIVVPEPASMTLAVVALALAPSLRRTKPRRHPEAKQ